MKVPSSYIPKCPDGSIIEIQAKTKNGTIFYLDKDNSKTISISTLRNICETGSIEIEIKLKKLGSEEVGGSLW